MAVKDIVAVQYEARMEPGTFGGREYTYYAEVPLKVGDVVKVPTKFSSNLARVSKMGIPAYRVPENIKAIMRHITNKPIAPAASSLQDAAVQLTM